MRNWLQQENHAILVVFILTAIVAMESIFSPIAPFFVFYGVLAIAIPLIAGGYRFGRMGAAFRGHWRVFIAVLIVAFFFDVLFVGPIWDAIAQALGHQGSAYWSYSAAIDALLGKAGTRLGIGKDAAQLIFAGYFILWAPIVEELFYRGYLFSSLRKRHSLTTAALVSAAFFGIRHATHFLFLFPAYPLIAAMVWVLDTFILGLAYAYLYEKTESLWPPFLAHLAINVTGFALSALAT